VVTPRAPSSLELCEIALRAAGAAGLAVAEIRRATGLSDTTVANIQQAAAKDGRWRCVGTRFVYEARKPGRVWVLTEQAPAGVAA